MKVTVQLNGNSESIKLEETLQTLGEIHEKNHHIKEFNVVVRIG